MPVSNEPERNSERVERVDNVVLLSAEKLFRDHGARVAPALAPSCTIIIPTLNEHDNIRPLIAALDAALDDLPVDYLFVDDWSQDGTAPLIEEIARTRPDVRLIRRHGRRGLASAAIEGMLATTAEIVAVIDADLQHDEAILPAMIAAVAAGRADIAIGSRYHAQGSCGQWSEHRARASRLATNLGRLATGTDVSDPLSGFFVVRRDAVIDLVPRLSRDGFKILLDILCSAQPALKAEEFPYEFRNRQAGESKFGYRVTFDYLSLIASKGMKRLFAQRFTGFALVGLSGVVVNLAVLRIALRWLPFVRAQAVAVAIAICCNFLLNNALTFRERRLTGLGLIAGLISFYLICGMGALANIGVSAAIFSSEHRWWAAALCGAVVGAGWNYLASAATIWRKHGATAG